MPGLLALTPPRKTARGRERDNFIVYLMLSGNTTFSTAEFTQLTNDAAGAFYQSPGPLTSAMRKAVDQIKPEGDRRFTSEWILYNILEMKFIEGRKVREVAGRLAMSEADLYRKQRVAVEAVARAILDMEQNEVLQ